MSVFRVNKTKDYTVMSNHHLRDKALSLKAKGLLSMMLALPDDWDYSVNGLVAICKEDVRAVKSALAELKEHGYLVVTKLYPNGERKRIEYVYDIFEKPQEVQNQEVQNVAVENVPLLNDTQLNTKESNTKESSTNNKKKVRKSNSFNEIINAYTSSPSTRELLGEWLQNRKAKRSAMTDNAIKRNIDKLDEYARESRMSVDDYIAEVVRRGWTAFYPIKNYQDTYRQPAQQANTLPAERRETQAEQNRVIELMSQLKA
jgi:hypothetical protein